MSYQKIQKLSQKIAIKHCLADDKTYIAPKVVMQQMLPEEHLTEATEEAHDMFNSIEVKLHYIAKRMKEIYPHNPIHMTLRMLRMKLHEIYQKNKDSKDFIYIVNNELKKLLSDSTFLKDLLKSQQDIDNAIKEGLQDSNFISIDSNPISEFFDFVKWLKDYSNKFPVHLPGL